MKHYWLAVTGICLLGLAGCIANDSLRTQTMSENNAWNLDRVWSGMSEGEVIYLMGKPYDYRTIWVGEDVYDIWFYVSKATGLGQTRMVRQNLTPMTFKNGVLVGWGYHFFDHVLKLERLQANKEAANTLEEEGSEEKAKEDVPIEKVLQAPAKPPAPTRTSAPIAPTPAPTPTPAAPTPAPTKNKPFIISQQNSLPGLSPEQTEPPAIQQQRTPPKSPGNSNPQNPNAPKSITPTKPPEAKPPGQSLVVPIKPVERPKNPQTKPLPQHQPLPQAKPLPQHQPLPQAKPLPQHKPLQQQPRPIKPPAKQQNPKEGEKTPGNYMSMSKSSDETEEAPAEQTPPEDGDPYLDKEDRRMLEDESDQNFNFW